MTPFQVSFIVKPGGFVSIGSRSGRLITKITVTATEDRDGVFFLECPRPFSVRTELVGLEPLVRLAMDAQGRSTRREVGSFVGPVGPVEPELMVVPESEELFVEPIDVTDDCRVVIQGFMHDESDRKPWQFRPPPPLL